LHRRILHPSCASDWDLGDASAPYLLGPWLLARDRADDWALLDELAASASVWDRRIVMMATFAGVRAGRPEATLRLADQLLTDPADLVQKTVGWMLREVANRDRPRAETFLAPLPTDAAHDAPVRDRTAARGAAP
jgi:3-methyladenine DNA glycosylase AlkD